MEERGKIEPHRITKPIQLLAAWLLGLISINCAFLVAAAKITNPEWVSGALVIACIVNVPLFLISIFLLQTKFRPEMQEDSFYSKYLESKTGNTQIEITPESVASIREDVALLEKAIAGKVMPEMNETVIEKLKWSSVRVIVNKNLDIFSKIVKELSNFGIPVHETFGAGASKPETFSVALGAGFDKEQIIRLVDALLLITDGWISFAEPEPEDDYDHKVLIGAYGGYSHGIELSKMKSLLQRADITQHEIYNVLGR